MNWKWKLHKLILCKIRIHRWIPLLAIVETTEEGIFLLEEIGQSCFYCGAK